MPPCMGKGVAKILAEPRAPSFSIEFVTTDLVEGLLGRRTAHPFTCKSCHQGNAGTPQFERKIILNQPLAERLRLGECGARGAGRRQCERVAAPTSFVTARAFILGNSNRMEAI